MPLISPSRLLLLLTARSAPVLAPAVCGNDVMARGLGWLTDQLQKSASQPVVYQRGTSRTGLCATFGKKLFKLDDGEGGIRMEWTDKDLLIPAAKLRISGVPVLPERGDRFIVNQDGVRYTYQVLAPGNENIYTWCDPYRKMLRIHGKLIEETPI